MSASKIVCRVGPAKDDKGEIVVTTRSGGRGTSTVSFKLLKPERIGKACTQCLQTHVYTLDVCYQPHPLITVYKRTHALFEEASGFQ